VSYFMTLCAFCLLFFPLLPLLIEPIQIIQRLFKSSKLLCEEYATKTALTNENSKLLRQAQCIHFACHGAFNKASPLESYLRLANQEALSLEEILELNLSQSSLVTLSACETGLSDYTSISDEYISLPSGFLLSGSPSVVSSLWKVDEVATAFLMIKFYEKLSPFKDLVEGNIARALNQAQIWLRDLSYEQFMENELPKYHTEINDILAKLPKGKRLITQSCIEQIGKRQPYPFLSPFYWAGFIAIGF
ncbi:CHAT domain-containing protein, partial [Microcoleus sp. F6_B4]